jgi:uncharacterized repeat protein (TIGR03803 family)
MKLNITKSIRIFSTLLTLFMVVAAVAVPCRAQTFTTLHSFIGTDGSQLVAALNQATNGTLYGTTVNGGANAIYGTVFTITLSGTITTLHSFDGTDGYGLDAGLVQANNGSFYGTASDGGLHNVGTVYKLGPTGVFSTVYNFCSLSGCTDGPAPVAGLIQGINGNLYGTTLNGGTFGAGSVFEMTPTGTLTTLHSFDVTDGYDEYTGLIQGADGNFYGTTAGGGVNSGGTVFKMTPTGTLTTLYSFCPVSGCTDGSSPRGALVQGTDGNFYGTTSGGGANDDGTVFKLTPAGVLTTLHSFDVTDGKEPLAGLIQATDGNFYGTTQGGGVGSGGVIFKISSTGTFSIPYNLCAISGCLDGAAPLAGLVQDTNGTMYGTTQQGGTDNLGTVFSLSVGLGPFVRTQQTAGKIGAAVNILGTNLTGASSVSFGGVPATFTVFSKTLITTTVPAAAHTGTVTVKVGATTLKSAQSYRVIPILTTFTPTSGPVGTPVMITGSGLTQTTKVSFNGKLATFTVNSDTLVTATVPTGATTGKITITTPGGSATTTGTFTVN